MPETVDKQAKPQGQVNLLKANERLVVTALRAQRDAATANRALAALSRSSELDSLTDLPNRHSLLSRFKYAAAIARRTGTQLAILFVDLNNFKQINDTLGHAVGDQVLRLAAKRLATAVRESDTVSRHGGDEFLILLSDISNPADVVQIATKLIAALGRAARVGEHLLQLTASIGISLFPGDAEDMQSLVQRADAAMYRAKRGNGGFAFHSDARPQEQDQPLPPSPFTQRQTLAHHRSGLAGQERRHAQLRDANEQLVLSALGAQKLQEEAQQAHGRQAEFLATVANELRNPLLHMQQATTLLDLDLARADESLLPRIQTVIDKQVKHMARLLGDLLDVSRMSAERPKLDCQMCDLTDTINAAVTACLPSIDLRLQRLTVKMATESLEVFGDPVRLTQVFSNLLDNASKYSHESSRIDLLVSRTNSSILVTISDTGIGMSTDSLSTVFEPFVQDAAAIVFSGPGLGIGLTVVRELVLAHGGTITAGSAGPGLGSTFLVTLPVAAKIATPTPVIWGPDGGDNLPRAAEESALT